MSDERTYDAEYYQALGVSEEDFYEMIRKENQPAEETSLKDAETKAAEDWWNYLVEHNNTLHSLGSTIGNIQLGYYEYNDITQRMERKYISGAAPLKGTEMYYQDIVDASNYNKLTNGDKVRLHNAAKEGRLFYFTATNEKHRYARAFSRVTGEGEFKDFNPDKEAQDLPSAEEPEKPKSVGWWNKVKAFFGNTKAKEKIADYNKSYDEYLPKKQAWDKFFKDCKTPKEIEEKRQRALMAREMKADMEEVSDVYTKLRDMAEIKGLDHSYNELREAAAYVDEKAMGTYVEEEPQEIPEDNKINEPEQKEINIENKKPVNVENEKQVQVDNQKQVNKAANPKPVNKAANPKQVNKAAKQKSANKKVIINPAGINKLASSMVNTKYASKATKMDDVMKLYRTAFLTLQAIKVAKKTDPKVEKSLKEQGTKLYAQILENRKSLGEIARNYGKNETVPDDVRKKKQAEINMCSEILSKSIFAPKKTADVQGPAKGM